MRKLFTLCLLVFSLSSSAQWQLTGARVRYVNGLGIPTRDTVAGVAADSSQIVIRPADSALYVKYKRTWLRVGGTGFTGSGTIGFLPRFTSSTSLGISNIYESGGQISIFTTSFSPGESLTIFGSLSQIQPISLVENTVKGTTMMFTTLTDVSNIGTKSNHLLGLITNNSIKAAITTGGQFNIGGNYASTNNTLQVAGNASIGSTTAAPANGLIVSGSVGIGTTSVGQKLTVEDNVNGSARVALLNSNTGTSAESFLFASTTGNRYTGFIQHGQNKTGTTAGLSNASLSEIQAGGDNSALLINQGSTTAPIVFALNSSERLRIVSAGRTLINTTTDNGVDHLQVNGSIQGTGFDQAYTARTTTYTATTNDYFIDCTSGTFTVNLFTAVGNTGRIIIVKNSGTGTITLDPNGAQTIDGAATQTLSTQWSRVHIISDGANWKIISN